MAALIAKECWIEIVKRFFGDLCAQFPAETKFCQDHLKVKIDKLLEWKPQMGPDGKWLCNAQGTMLEFRHTASDEELVKCMRYFCDQFYPFESELLSKDYNVSFFMHPEQEIIKHMCIKSVWRVASEEQRYWIWEQFNIIYQIASSLKRLPEEVFVHLHRLIENTKQSIVEAKQPFSTLHTVRLQALQITKEVGEDKFRILLRYFYSLLQSPYSPFPEFVPPQYKFYAKKFLALLQTEHGIKFLQRHAQPFIAVAKEHNLPVPSEKELQGEDGKLDDGKVVSVFKTVMEQVTEEKALTTLYEKKDTIIQQMKDAASTKWNELVRDHDRGSAPSDSDDSDEEKEDDTDDKDFDAIDWFLEISNPLEKQKAEAFEQKMKSPQTQRVYMPYLPSFLQWGSKTASTDSISTKQPEKPEKQEATPDFLTS
jgi:hypothetical protein